MPKLDDRRRTAPHGDPLRARRGFRILYDPKTVPPEVAPYLRGDKRTSAHVWIDNDGEVHLDYGR